METIQRVAKIIEIGGGAITKIYLGKWWYDKLRYEMFMVAYIWLEDLMRFEGIPVELIPDDEYMIDVE